MLTTVQPVPAQRYSFPAEDIDWVLDEFRQVLEKGGFLTLGRHGEAFEHAFASYVGTPYATAVNSGTAALEIILRALEVHGGEVIVPTNTFAATAFAVIHAGAVPVFADCGPDLCVDPIDVARRVTPRTRAVIAVHIGGLVAAGVSELVDLCRVKGLPLVEDAAHAHGSAFEGRKAGTFGIAGAFSFFSTKVMTTGEGGMIVTADRSIFDRAAVLRDQAKVAGANRHDDVGYNWRMTEVQALLGLAQLRRLDAFIERRRAIARIYDEEFADAEPLVPCRIPAQAHHNFYKYILFAEGHETVARLERSIREQWRVSMGGKVYDLPCHEQPVFRRYVTEPLPMAERLCRTHVCPPIYPQLQDHEARYVAQAVLQCLDDRS